GPVPAGTWPAARLRALSQESACASRPVQPAKSAVAATGAAGNRRLLRSSNAQGRARGCTSFMIFAASLRILSPILRPHVGAGLRQALRHLRRRSRRLGGGPERPPRQRRPGADAFERGLLHLRSGAAVPDDGARRFPHARSDDAARLLRTDAGAPRTGLRRRTLAATS